MKLKLCVSGRLRKGPELTLFNDYRTRSEKIGKLVHLSSTTVLEYDSLKWTRLVLQLRSSKLFSLSSHKVLLDKRGQVCSSEAFAKTLRSHRDTGTQEVIFFIGGANGVPESQSDNFDEVLSFGQMIWPHFLARVMLMEQIYRASTILAGLPYHKD